MEINEIILGAVFCFFAIACGAVYIGGIKNDRKKRKEYEDERTSSDGITEYIEPRRFERPDDYLRDRDWRYMDVFIAGLAHHCTRRDIGYFAGTVFNEHDNPYNSKAMAIGNQETKQIMGYVPEKILSEFRSWCKGKNCSCAGIIFEEDGILRGRIRAYLDKECSEAAILQNVQDYIFDACDRFGWKNLI